MAYPNRKFEDDEVFLLKRLNKGLILDLVKNTKATTYQGISDRDGAVILNCADEETAEWLKTIELSFKEVLQLRPLEVDELPKTHRVFVHMEDPEMTTKEALELIDKQNKNLASHEWFVMRARVRTPPGRWRH